MLTGRKNQPLSLIVQTCLDDALFCECFAQHFYMLSNIRTSLKLTEPVFLAQRRVELVKHALKWICCTVVSQEGSRSIPVCYINVLSVRAQRRAISSHRGGRRTFPFDGALTAGGGAALSLWRTELVKHDSLSFSILVVI